MSTHFDSNTPVNESILSAQSEKAKVALEYLEALKQETDVEWAKENIDGTIELAKAKEGMQ